MTFVDLMKLRRSRYQLTDKLPISVEELEKIIEGCIKQTPSAFNSQSARVLLLLGASHKRLWELVLQSLRAVVPDDKFAPTEEKIASFAAAYGTILYFDDTRTVRALQEKFPTYKDNFPVWAQQAGGMLQFAVWTALAEAGVGASLQHYNPLIDQCVAAQWHVPADWRLVAQMPFGQPAAPAEEKTYLPLSERFRVER